MKKHKIKVAVLFGGRSSEHDISLLSAAAVIDHINRDQYTILPIGITRDGAWFLGDEAAIENELKDFFSLARPVVFCGEKQNEAYVADLATGEKLERLELIFPVLHGPYGEDGTIQGLAQFYGIPFVGSGVLGSAVAMDKDVTKRLLSHAGLRVASFITLTHGEIPPNLAELIKPLGLPLFVKPANMGSSIGISQVKNEGELMKALELAFRYDTKVIIEEAVQGRELECAVLGNVRPRASSLGEIKVKEKGAFYSYVKKYQDEAGVELIIPASIPPHVDAKARDLARRAFRVLDLKGLARVDFFLSVDNELIINEINTMPGFTRFSMYPKLWEESGIGYNELIAELMALALQAGTSEDAGN